MAVIWDLLQARGRVHLQLSKLQHTPDGEDIPVPEQVTMEVTPVWPPWLPAQELGVLLPDPLPGATQHRKTAPKIL